MSKSDRPVVVPGETFDHSNLGDNPDNAGLPPDRTFGEDTGPLDTDDSSLAPAKVTQPLKGDADQQIAAMRAQMDEMLNRQNDLAEQNMLLVRQINSVQVKPGPVDLPTLKQAMDSKPDAPVLTQEGWYTPPVTTANPEVRR